MKDLTNLKEISVSEEVMRWNKVIDNPTYKESKECKFKINADFILKNMHLECYREQMVSFITLLPIIENAVPFEEADYILYMHPYARIEDASEFVLSELRMIDRNRKKDAEIIVLGKSANAERKLNGSIKNITFWGDHFAEKVGKKFDMDIKERYFVYDDMKEFLAIWPVDGCMQKCGFCRRNYMDIKFESIPLEVIKENMDFIKEVAPEKMKHISLRAENLTEYGIDIYGEQKLDELLNLINSYDEVEKLSFSIGLAIGEITPKILEALCNCKKIEYLELNLEVGSDRLLKLIGKQHTNKQAIHIYHKIKQYHPESYISSTVMVGLPTEELIDMYNLADVISKTKPDEVYCVFYGIAPSQPLAKLPQLSESLREYHLKILIQQLRRKVDSKMLFCHYHIFKNKSSRKTYRCKQDLNASLIETGIGSHFEKILYFN